MKKFLFTLSGLVCALGCTFGLAACGDDSEGDDGKNGGDADNIPNADNIVTEQVTEAQWNAAFDFLQVNNVSVQNAFKTMTGQEREDSIMLSKYTPDKYYGKDTYQKMGGSELVPLTETEEYYEKTASAVYHYTYDGTVKKWEKNLAEDIFPTANDLFINTATQYQFSAFSYSEADKAYVSESDNVTVSVKITNGKIAAIVTESEEENSDTNKTSYVTQTEVFYNFGTTTVTIPQEAANVSVDNHTVTQAIWETALGSEAFVNFTYTNRPFENDSSAPAGSSVYKFDFQAERCLHEENVPAHNYYYGYAVAHVGGNILEYYKQDGEDWIYYSWADNMTNALETTLNEQIQYIIGLKNSFSEFTYDKSNGTFSAKRTRITVNGVSSEYNVKLQFIDGKLTFADIEKVSNSGNEQKVLGFFSDYGSTVITLPQNAQLRN